jgi:hypothetical protein
MPREKQKHLVSSERSIAARFRDEANLAVIRDGARDAE